MKESKKDLLSDGNGSFSIRRFGWRRASRAVALLAVSALAALAAPTRSLAQAPTFNALVTTPTGSAPWTAPGSAAVGDFNGDGKLDALVSDGSQDLRLMLGNGNGTFTQYNIGVPGASPGQIRAADLNGDGKLDAVFVSPQGNLAPTVLLNTGNDVNGVPQFTATTYTPVYSGLRSVTVGDLNGDGSPDFIVGNAYGSLYVYLNNGNGTFAAGQATNLMPNVGGSTGPGVIADLNGDGKADYVVTSNQAGATDIFFGNGDGTLQAPVVIPSSTTSIAVADVNGDGKLDLLAVANGAPNQLLVYLNTGGGSFSAPTPYSTGGAAWNGWTQVTTADVNGDGKLDAVVTNSFDNNVAVFLGDGSGTFGAPVLFAVNLRPLDVSVGDFNGDGKPDIATVGAGGYGGNTYGVLLNNAPPLFFTDSLTGPTSPPDITIPAAKYGYTASGLQRTQSDNTTDRPIVKTNSAAYLTANNFTAEVTVKLANIDILYFGLGQGDMDPNYFNEPSHAFYFRVHSGWQGNYSIQADVRSIEPGGVFTVNEIGSYALGSTITLRIVRLGNSVTMSVVGGGSVTYSLSAYPSLGLTNSNTRVFFGNTTVGSVFSNFSVTTPSATLALGDIVGGGDGSGNGTFNTGISARDGSVAGTVWAGDGLGTGFHTPASGNPRIDGVFVPNGATQVSTTGLNYGFPATNGRSWDAIRNGVSTLENNQDVNPIYDATGAVTTVGVGIHANAGITFDLVQIAALYPGLQPSSFTGNVGGKPSPIRCGTGDAIARVLIDGVLVYSKQVGLIPDPSTLFNITIPAGAGFLTLATTDGGNGYGCDKAYFANALLQFSPVPTDSTPPVITVLGNITAEATGSAGASVTFSVSATDDVDGPVPVSCVPASGSTFPLGTTTVNCSATDAAGNHATASFTITVRDTTPPAITSVTPSQASLWPPNHQVVPITLNAVATDAVGVSSLKIIRVTSNEPDDGLGDGDTPNDIRITGNLTLNLRAERSGKGNGRVYTITVEARDAANNVATKTVTVSVPKNQGGK